jgi:hypothetical protein
VKRIVLVKDQEKIGAANMIPRAYTRLCFLFAFSIMSVYGTDDDVCLSCQPNSYCDMDGAYPCPLHSNSSAFSKVITDCICQAGYTGMNGTECTACAPGTYKDVVGDGLCELCSGGKYSGVAGSSGCESCPANTSMLQESPGQTHGDCVCDAGYVQTNSSGCQACAAGTYKTMRGDLPCYACGPGKFSSTLAATSEDTCLSCPLNAFSISASSALDDCICPAGFEGALGVDCTKCTPGTYKEDVGLGDCSMCPPGTYSQWSHGWGY